MIMLLFAGRGSSPTTTRGHGGPTSVDRHGRGTRVRRVGPVECERAVSRPAPERRVAPPRTEEWHWDALRPAGFRGIHSPEAPLPEARALGVVALNPIVVHQYRERVLVRELRAPPRRAGVARAVGELRARQQRDVHVERGVERGVEVRLVLLPRGGRVHAPGEGKGGLRGRARRQASSLVVRSK